MRAVAVRRLSVRVPPGQGAAARQRAEDALFLAAPDETRLVILRHLPLGRISVRADARAWTARAAARIEERRARAVHAAAAGAEGAEAVWFRSVEEAEALLLLLLAAGQAPSAWFWRLAVPHWRGLGLAPLIADWAARAAHEPAQAVALARALVAAIAAGFLPALVAAAPPRVPRPAAGAAAALPSAAPRSPTASALPTAERLMARHGVGVQHAVRTMLCTGSAAATAAWLVRQVLLAAAPELAGHEAALETLAAALVAAWSAPGALPVPTAVEALAPAAPSPEAEALSPARPEPPGERDVPARPHRPWPRHDRPAPPAVAVALPSGSVPRPAGDAPSDAVPAASQEHASAGAGVLLAIPALERLGLGARLAGDPEAAAAAFGRHLLRHIAARARLPPGDALFLLLEAPDPPPDAGRLHAWRVGLDRWLCRRARLRLCDLARRPGWLHRAEAILQVRFPVDAADLRLRRLALDSDPNWVPWLGLSVRYHYRDRPLA